MRDAFELLELPEDADERTVRRAYARLLKGIDQVKEPQAFMALRAAYERALAIARSHAEDEDEDEDEEVDADQVQSSQASAPLAESERREDSTQAESEPEPGPDPDPRVFVMRFPGAAAERILSEAQWSFQPWEVDGATDELKRLLAHPELENLEARESFERQLASLIAGKALGARRSALLLAADSLFDWRRKGVGVESLEFVLDTLESLRPSQRKIAMALLGEPDPEVARELQLTPEHLRHFYVQWQNFLDWWLPEEHVHRWTGAWGRLPAPWRAVEKFRQTKMELVWWIRAYAKRLLVIGIFAIAGIFLFQQIADRTREKQNAQTLQACAQKLAIPRAAAWHDVPAEGLWELEQCSSDHAIGTGADMRGMAQAQRIANALSGKSDSRWASLSGLGARYLRLNLRDGRAFGFVRPESSLVYCPELRNFMLRSHWLQVGDLPSAKAIVHELAWCEEQTASGASQGDKIVMASDRYRVAEIERNDSPGFWKLLHHVDAWPGAERPVIALQSLVQEATLRDFEWRLPPELGAIECAPGTSASTPCRPQVDHTSKVTKDLEAALRRHAQPKLPELRTYEQP
ncbi:J domain-containing protein [Diaphorobacter caeni]|uniref:J domain-containing protein n=1 Tax=Diaphorobacter caeni TaxID=2784387 RepID=UPI00188F0944|nr:J domain-containing protein [Diaphorobacter caeni]MBF5004976.1 J domain-containing protein [Diaphorobacter caeni]